MFVSKNKALLSATILTFMQAIYPFKWPYTCIMNIPDQLQVIFDSPMPFIGGLNKNTRFVHDTNLI